MRPEEPIFRLAAAVALLMAALAFPAAGGLVKPVDVVVSSTYGEWPASNTLDGTFDGGNPEPDAIDPASSVLDDPVGDVWFGNEWFSGRIMWDLGETYRVTDLLYWVASWRGDDYGFTVAFDVYVTTESDPGIPDWAWQAGEVVPTTGDWGRVLSDCAVSLDDQGSCRTFSLGEPTEARWVLLADLNTPRGPDHPSIGDVRFLGEPSSSIGDDKPGDLDGDGDVDADDVDLLRASFGQPDQDLDGDGDTDPDDLVFLVENYLEWERSNPGAGVGTLLGDINLDGLVDENDRLALAAGFGSQGGWADGNLDGDDLVDIADLTILRTNLGMAATTGTVPEPATLGLLGLGGLALLRRRKK